MELTIRPKNFKLADNIEIQVRKRVERLPRFLENVQTAEVVLSQQPTRLTPQRFQYVAQLTLQTPDNVIRSEVADPELLTAMDEVISNISRQIERYKGRHTRKRKGNAGLGRGSADVANTGPLPQAPSVVETAAPARSDLSAAATTTKGNGSSAHSVEVEEEGGNIVRVKRFRAKPMYPEEAVEQMELLGHSFFVFWNAADERINVVYRRNDGDYGLLEPELT